MTKSRIVERGFSYEEKNHGQVSVGLEKTAKDILYERVDYYIEKADKNLYQALYLARESYEYERLMSNSPSAGSLDFEASLLIDSMIDTKESPLA